MLTARESGNHMLTSTIRALLLSCGTALMLTACQFSFSSGGLDHEKLANAITDELNASYEPISQQVSSVECPEDENPGPGETIICTASVGDQTVRVESTVTDEDYNVDFSTLDTLYDQPSVGAALSEELTNQLGFPVTVNCGDGLMAVEIG
ncbi:MAG: DUF4333 domain-containing protein, partial [Actinomycetota bacterium]|nr:DUF4333 domain-containing protein [Actinomycetota bacterium]